MDAQLIKKIEKIRCILMDVDGVLTNNEMVVTEEGEMLRTMNARDGLAIRMAIDHGFFLGIITGGYSEGVKIRMHNLGCKYIYSGIKDKLSAFEEIQMKSNLLHSEFAFFGDDLPDIPVFSKVGFSACPSDAVQEVLSKVDHISPFGGGKGMVRHTLELILKVQKKWIFGTSSFNG